MAGAGLRETYQTMSEPASATGALGMSVPGLKIDLPGREHGLTYEQVELTLAGSAIGAIVSALWH